MKQTLIFVAVGAVALGASAQEIGRVVSRTPVAQQVAVPHQVCNNQLVQAPTSGGGTVLGALAGAGVGSAIGHGGGNAAAIVAGSVLGAVVGNSVEAQNNTRVVPNCVTENVYENRTVAWNVVYEYQGRQYAVQMPYDPGNTVQLQVAQPEVQQQATGEPGPVVTAPPMQQAQMAPAPQPQVIAQQQVYAQPQVIAQPQVVQGAPVMVAQQPVYAAPYPYPYAYPYPYYRPYPIGLNFSFGYWGHGHH